MYQKFDIILVKTDLKSKSVYIEFTQDIDENSVSLENVTITEKGSNKIVYYDYEIDNKVLKLIFKDWPIPNKEYILVTQPGLISVVGKKIENTIKRKIFFNSDILSKIKILSPNNFEEIEKLKITWKEIPGKDEKIINNYFVEIATNNIFDNPVISSEIIGKNEIFFATIESNQYYIRVRAQLDNMYGEWSEIVTFLYNKKSDFTIEEENNEVADNNSNTDTIDSLPEYEQELAIITYPENGVTNDRFIIEFDEELDPSNDIEIIVYRKRL